MKKTIKEMSEEICDPFEWTLTITAIPIKSEHFNPMSTSTDLPTYSYDRIQIGICSLCGGIVTVPAVWLGTIPPSAICSSCGAVQKRKVMPNLDLPVLDMEKPNWSQDWYSTDSTTGDKYSTRYSPGSTTGDDK